MSPVLLICIVIGLIIVVGVVLDKIPWERGAMLLLAALIIYVVLNHFF